MRRFHLFFLALFFSIPAFSAPDSVPNVPVEFAFRDPVQNGGKLVVIQGVRNGSAPLSRVCGELGDRCDCIFYRSPTDRSPKVARASGMSTQNNTVSCALQRVTGNLHEFEFIRLRNRWNNLVTEPQRIRTALTLEDVIGHGLAKELVTGIFRHSCTRTFLEGEGVTPSTITCTPGQHLGVISAGYSFYTFRNAYTSISGGGDFPFSGPICNRNSFLKYQCSSSAPQLRYGFYGMQQGPFQVPVSMTRAPEAIPGDTVPLTTVYGYVALPDSAGNCPTGLMKARQWMAQPASITEGSLGQNPPSSFINQGNSLSNTMVEASQPANFVVARQPNSTPCAQNGDCTNATFGGTSTAQSVLVFEARAVASRQPASGSVNMKMLAVPARSYS
jgi:hypothetical protein